MDSYSYLNKVFPGFRQVQDDDPRFTKFYSKQYVQQKPVASVNTAPLTNQNIGQFFAYSRNDNQHYFNKPYIPEQQHINYLLPDQQVPAPTSTIQPVVPVVEHYSNSYGDHSHHMYLSHVQSCQQCAQALSKSKNEEYLMYGMGAIILILLLK